MALKPAGRDEFRRELTACLALCGASGMNEDARREWLIAATGTLRDIPADLLARGAARARETCDHPSKIVPAILAEVRETWETRRRQRVELIDARLPAPAPKPAEPVCTPEQAKAIMEDMGIPPYAQELVKRAVGPLRKPTRADYLAMGVDPATLDAMEAK